MSGFAHAFSSGLILPAICLAAIGWAVPKLLALFWPEGVWPLMALAFVSAIVMTIAGMGFFVLLYWFKGFPVSSIFEAGVMPGLLYFLRLGGISALLWAPIMILSVAGLPKHWRTRTW